MLTWTGRTETESNSSYLKLMYIGQDNRSENLFLHHHNDNLESLLNYERKGENSMNLNPFLSEHEKFDQNDVLYNSMLGPYYFGY